MSISAAGEEPEASSSQEAESGGLSKAQKKRLKKKEAAANGQDGDAAPDAVAAAEPAGADAAAAAGREDDDSGDEEEGAAEGGEAGAEGAAKKKKKKKCEWAAACSEQRSFVGRRLLPARCGVLQQFTPRFPCPCSHPCSRSQEEEVGGSQRAGSGGGGGGSSGKGGAGGADDASHCPRQAAVPRRRVSRGRVAVVQRGVSGSLKQRCAVLFQPLLQLALVLLPWQLLPTPSHCACGLPACAMPPTTPRPLCSQRWCETTAEQRQPEVAD